MPTESEAIKTTTQRNIPAGMIDDASQHVYEAAIRYLGWDMYYHNEPEA